METGKFPPGKYPGNWTFYFSRFPGVFCRVPGKNGPQKNAHVSLYLAVQRNGCNYEHTEKRAYKATGQKSATLEKLYKALLTIKLSSVESERAFSRTGFLWPISEPECQMKTWACWGISSLFLGLAKTTGRIAKRVKRKAVLLKMFWCIFLQWCYYM